VNNNPRALKDPYHLTDDETLLVDLRPHWVRLLPSGSRALGATVVASWFTAKLPESWPLMDWVTRLIWLGAVYYLARFAVDLARWWFTHFAITSERIIVRSGVISRNGVEIPLDRVNTVFFEQRVHERLLGAGDITIESASEQGRQRFDDVKNPNQVQQRIYQAREELASRARRLQGEEIARGLAAQQRDEDTPPGP
jgi:uncharacterized membrane protein YdbT with pleckstrin-like domain